MAGDAVSAGANLKQDYAIFIKDWFTFTAFLLVEMVIPTVKMDLNMEQKKECFLVLH